MKHTTSRQLYAYWNQVRGERSAPVHDDIDPGAIRHILADTFVLELDSGGRARFRMVGTRCCALFGRELRSTYLADLWARHGTADLQHLLHTVVQETAGVVSGLHGITEDGGAASLEALLLPLRTQGKDSTCIVGAIVPTFPLGWIGTRPLARLETVSMRIIRPDSTLGAPARSAEPQPAPRDRFVVYEGGLA